MELASRLSGSAQEITAKAYFVDAESKNCMSEPFDDGSLDDLAVALICGADDAGGTCVFAPSDRITPELDLP